MDTQRVTPRYDNVVRRAVPQWAPRPDEAPVPLRLVKMDERPIHPLVGWALAGVVSLAMWVGIFAGIGGVAGRGGPTNSATTFTPAEVPYVAPAEPFVRTVLAPVAPWRPSGPCVASDGCTGVLMAQAF